MEVNAVQANIEEVARRWSAERATRQNRRNLDPADFAELAKAGFNTIAVPVAKGGLWVDINTSTRTAAELVRAIAHGDPSVALVSAMHPAVIALWLGQGQAPAQHLLAWEQQRDFIFESAMKGEYWGTITSEPGSGGDVAKTKATAAQDGRGGYLLSGQKHFGSGSGVTSYMITTALPEGETEADWFFINVKDAKWDGSNGMKLVAEWDGHGMAATQSHAFEFSGYPASRLAWPGNLMTVAGPVGPMISTIFIGVIVGVTETAYGRAREQLGRRLEAVNAYERTEWTRVESEMWQIHSLYETALRSIEAKGSGAALDVLQAKTAIAELAESMTQRICRVIGGATFAKGSPFGAAFEDVRALGFLRPPWGLAYEQLWQRVWART